MSRGTSCFPLPCFSRTGGNFPLFTFPPLFPRPSAKGKFANNDCLGIRSYEADGKRGPFVFETYSDVTDQVERLSVALRKKFGLGPKAAVGIFSQNRPEWVKTLIATWYNGDFCVPLYDTLGATAVAYILNDSDVTTVFCSKNKLELVSPSGGERQKRGPRMCCCPRCIGLDRLGQPAEAHPAGAAPCLPCPAL